MLICKLYQHTGNILTLGSELSDIFYIPTIQNNITLNVGTILKCNGVLVVRSSPFSISTNFDMYIKINNIDYIGKNLTFNLPIGIYPITIHIGSNDQNITVSTTLSDNVTDKYTQANLTIYNFKEDLAKIVTSRYLNFDKNNFDTYINDNKVYTYIYPNNFSEYIKITKDIKIIIPPDYSN